MRHPSVIAFIAVLVLFGAAGAAVVVLDHRADAKIADGVTVGGVDLGGISPKGARARLQREVVGGLDAPVVVHHGPKTWRLSARRARVAADVTAMVDQAVERSRRGNIFTRASRELTGGSVQADLPARVTFDRKPVRALVRRVQAGVNRPARDAKVSFAASGVSRQAGASGLSVNAAQLARSIDKALAKPGAERTFSASTRKVEPKVTSSQLADRYPVAVVVDRANFRLRLYKNLKLTKTYPVAVGRAGLETPAGLYDVANKAVSPAWHVPNSAWAGSLAGQVIPGGAPNNPIKARWLGIADGVGVHGTSDDASIGSNASHGCIRMHISDVIDLYDRVPVKAPIYIA